MGGCFSVNVGNLKLDRSENVSNILLYLEKTETEEHVITNLKLNALTLFAEAEQHFTFWYATCVVQVSWPGLALTRPLVLSDDPLPWK